MWKSYLLGSLKIGKSSRVTRWWWRGRYIELRLKNEDWRLKKDDWRVVALSPVRLRRYRISIWISRRIKLMRDANSRQGVQRFSTDILFRPHRLGIGTDYETEQCSWVRNQKTWAGSSRCAAEEWYSRHEKELGAGLRCQQIMKRSNRGKERPNPIRYSHVLFFHPGNWEGAHSRKHSHREGAGDYCAEQGRPWCRENQTLPFYKYLGEARWQVAADGVSGNCDMSSGISFVNQILISRYQSEMSIQH